MGGEGSVCSKYNVKLSKEIMNIKLFKKLAEIFILVSARGRQEDCYKFEAYQGYIEKPGLKTNQIKHTQTSFI